jgi:hypothetical protein
MSVPPDAATEMLLTSSANLARGCGGPGHFLRVGFALDGGLGRTTVETHRDIERVGIGGRFGPPIVIDLLLAFVPGSACQRRVFALQLAGRE